MENFISHWPKKKKRKEKREEQGEREPRVRVVHLQRCVDVDWMVMVCVRPIGFAFFFHVVVLRERTGACCHVISDQHSESLLHWWRLWKALPCTQGLQPFPFTQQLARQPDR